MNNRLRRSGIRSILPAAIRRRAKAPLAYPPLVQALRRKGALSTEFVPAPALLKYVAVDELPRITGKEGSDELWSRTLPLSLNVWLRHWAAIPANAISGLACEEVHQ